MVKPEELFALLQIDTERDADLFVGHLFEFDATQRGLDRLDFRTLL